MKHCALSTDLTRFCASLQGDYCFLSPCPFTCTCYIEWHFLIMADFNVCPGIWQFKVMFIWELHDIWSQFLRHFNSLSLLFVNSWVLFTCNSPAEYPFAWEGILLNFVYLNEMLLVCYMTAICLVSVAQDMLKFLNSRLWSQQPAGCFHGCKWCAQTLAFWILPKVRTFMLQVCWISALRVEVKRQIYVIYPSSSPLPY